VSRRFRSSILPDPGEQVRLDPEASHHLLHVLLVPRGETVTLFDGDGRSCTAVLTGVEEERATLQGQSAITATPLGPEVVLLQALCKGQAFERAVRMATELGVTRIVPVLTERCVAKGDRGDRWARIAESAAAQSGRADLPTIEALQPLAIVLEREDLPTRRLLALPGAPSGTNAAPADVAILLGPEGGLTENEVEAALSTGFEAVGLGSHVLRAETATAAALARYAPH
jgi:16S rRNA (uracil1498-N3)-methyltransferase